MVIPEERVLIISSDGHVSARMEDYREYLPSKYHEEFDAFCVVYREKGSRSVEPPAMLKRLDPDVVQTWQEEVIDADRLGGIWETKPRFEELERHGVAAEVLFPDFGLPFELYAPLLAASLGYSRSPEQVTVANRAYNRWLADFCSEAPGRFAGQASVAFDDVDAAIAEIRWAKEAGLKGVLVPMFGEEEPIFHERHDPIWATAQELGMPINSHIAISSITDHVPKVPPLPHAAVALPIFGAQLHFACHQILNHLIWGGVLERFPELQVVFTEMGSAWVVPELQSMDYSWNGSFLRRDIREVVRHKPSEYFQRQCHLGSSLFSLAEAESRHSIGIDRMTIGADYPHHEGSWGVGPGHLEYLRATLGVAKVPPDEARLMLGGNALKLWGFSREVLQPIADRIGPSLAQVLTPPEREYFPRGDVHKPLASGAF